MCKGKEPKPKLSFLKKGKIGRLTIPHFYRSYKAIVIMTAWQ